MNEPQSGGFAVKARGVSPGSSGKMAEAPSGDTDYDTVSQGRAGFRNESSLVNSVAESVAIEPVGRHLCKPCALACGPGFLNIRSQLQPATLDRIRGRIGYNWMKGS
jgi:hypothetical protein